MKSQKSVIPLKDIVRPYEMVPKEDLDGGVNGKPFLFPKGKKARFEYPVFEALFHAGKIDLGGD